MCLGGFLIDAIDSVSSYPASQQQPSAVSCSVVCEAHRNAIFGQFVRVSSTHDVVSFDLCICNLERSETTTSQTIFSLR